MWHPNQFYSIWFVKVYVQCPSNLIVEHIMIFPALGEVELTERSQKSVCFPWSLEKSISNNKTEEHWLWYTLHNSLLYAKYLKLFSLMLTQHNGKFSDSFIKFTCCIAAYKSCYLPLPLYNSSAIFFFFLPNVVKKAKKNIWCIFRFLL